MKKGIDRRNFLKNAGAMTLGSAFASSCVHINKGAKETGDSQTFESAQVPHRTLGRTGEVIPVIGLGCVFDFTKLHHILNGCLQYGVNYWDTATNYGNLKSQLGIGQYLGEHPEVRKNLFLISKPIDEELDIPNVDAYEIDLHESLERCQTDYFDVYCAVHGLKDPAQLTDDVKDWAESCKKRGLFKYLGYSAHTNMAASLEAAAKCGWIDVALVAYNFQLMQDDNYQRAIDNARKADIGLIAIKTQRKVSLDPMPFETEADRKLAEHFIERGFTDGQAKLKIVIEDERFASAAVGMNKMDILTQNVAATIDQTKLTQADRKALHEYAQATCDRYCAGCTRVCNAHLPDMPYVNHIARYTMYNNSYGQHKRARDLFAQIPEDVRKRLLCTDYSAAEAHCPNHFPIAKVIAEAVDKLA